MGFENRPTRPSGITDTQWWELLLEWREERAERRAKEFRQTWDELTRRMDGQDKRMDLNDERVTRNEDAVSGLRTGQRWLIGLVVVGVFGVMATLGTTVLNLIIKISIPPTPPPGL